MRFWDRNGDVVVAHIEKDFGKWSIYINNVWLAEERTEAEALARLDEYAGVRGLSRKKVKKPKDQKPERKRRTKTEKEVGIVETLFGPTGKRHTVEIGYDSRQRCYVLNYDGKMYCTADNLSEAESERRELIKSKRLSRDDKTKKKTFDA